VSRTDFPASTQALIQRLAALDYSRPTIDRDAITRGLMAHLTALDQPLRPVYFAVDLADALERIRVRAQRSIDAAIDKSPAAARAAAWDAAWDLGLNDPAIAAKMSPAQRAAVEMAKAMDGAIADAFASGMWLYIVTADEVIAVARAELHIDDRLRLHNANGPAMMWQHGGARFWFWRGVKVPQHVIESPASITAQEIDAETNTEVRRVMLERFGAERYLRETHATKVAEDSFGILWRKDVRDDEPIVMVQLLNSTPEPDGVLTRKEAERIFGKPAVASAIDYAIENGIEVGRAPRFKEYYLRVPPTMRTPHEAVAWTFGLTPKTYRPVAQS